jgi:hypothetical protein
VRLPEDLILFAHYKLQSGAISFAGQGQFLETNMNHQLGTGWSWNGVLRVRRQAEAGERVLYEVGNRDGSPPSIRLAFSEDGTLSANLGLSPETEVRAAAPHFDQSPFFDAFSYVRIDVVFPNQAAPGDLALSVNGNNVGRAPFSSLSMPRTVTRQVIGSDLGGQRAATFDIQELVIVDHVLTAAQAASIARYFWLEWHG